MKFEKWFALISLIVTFAIIPISLAHANTELSGRIIVNVDGLETELYASSEALLVYASDYEPNSGWDDLPTIPAEMQSLRLALEKQGFKVSEVPNAKSTELLEEIRKFIAQKGISNKRLLVYFAGHGWIDKDGRGYLVPTDAPNPADDEQLFRERAISESEVQAWALNFGSRHALFIFDSCFSGTILGTKGVVGSPQVPQGRMSRRAFNAIRPNNVIFISATNKVQTVPSTGIFTRKVIAGIGGEADQDKNGYIYATELAWWLVGSQYSDHDYGDAYKPRWGPIGRNADAFSDEYTGAMFILNSQPTEVVGDDTPKAVTSEQARLNSVPKSVWGATSLTMFRPEMSRFKMFHAAEAPKSKATAAAASYLISQDDKWNGWFVRYYQKFADGDKVIDVLNRNRISYLARDPELPETFVTNAVSCHPDGDIEGPRNLALLLHDAGISILAMVPFKDRTKHKRRIEVMSLGDSNGPFVAPPLSRKQLEQIASCRSVFNGKIK